MRSGLLTPDRIRFDPHIPANTYHDSFREFCHVIHAPSGRLTMSTEFLVQDKGEPDEVALQALGELPVEVLIGSACRSRQPLRVS